MNPTAFHPKFLATLGDRVMLDSMSPKRAITVFLIVAVALFIARRFMPRQNRAVRQHTEDAPESEPAQLPQPPPSAPQPTAMPTTELKETSPKQVAPIPSSAKSASAKTPAYPRGLDELTEEQFVAKYKASDIAALAHKKPLTSFTGVPNGIVFIIHDGRLIDIPDGQLQYRQWMSHGRTEDELGSDACIAIRKSDSEPVVGSVGEGTLTIRDGPLRNSFLYAIADKHFFLIYDDMIAWKEMEGNPHMTGILLYYLRDENGKIVYQGSASRWFSPDPTMRLSGADFCHSTTDPER